MSGPQGRICRDLFCGTLTLKGKLVLDENCNLTVANSFQTNAHVYGNIFTNGIHAFVYPNGNISPDICVTGNLDFKDGYGIKGDVITDRIIEANVGNTGIQIIGNICVEELYSIQASKIEAKTAENGLVVQTYLPKNKFGLGRAHTIPDFPIVNDNTVHIPLETKTYESAFTTEKRIIHPSANTLVTFQAPSTANISCLYTCALVRCSVGAKVNFLVADTDDTLTLSIYKNKTGPAVSQYHHTVGGPCVDAKHTFAWSDVIKVEPEDTLDLYVYGGNISGNLNAIIVGGESNTFASFQIESFDI